MRSALLTCGLLLSLTAQAAPFTPADDAVVVERLPLRLAPQWRAAREQLARAPADLALAVRTAQAALERGRRSGDPRELGAAQALLAPWWADAAPPPEVRLLRATVRQSQHDFATALRDLDGLLAAGDAAALALRAQAELTRASVLQVTGRLAEAQAACERLGGARYAALGAAVATTAQVCVAELRSLRGEAAVAVDTLARLDRGDPWIALVRAELAERMGDDRGAEALYRRAALRPEADVYSRAAFADWLLARGRAAEVLRQLGADAGADEADALLLRRAIALKGLGDPAAADAARRLRERLDATSARGDRPHEREAALLALDVFGDGAGALRHAQALWAQQKEPADALLLWRAARAAGRPGAADPLRRFVREQGLQDLRLAGLLEAKP